MNILIHRNKREWEPILNRVVRSGERLSIGTGELARRLLHAGAPNYRWKLEIPPPPVPPAGGIAAESMKSELISAQDEESIPGEEEEK